MLSLEILLKKTIKKIGAISVKDFFSVVLYHEVYGYYEKKNILGKSGDFTTSPEISQVFGEILCNSILLNYKELEKNKHISFIELGPGRGLLAKDILRTIKKLNNNFYQKLESIYFLEKSKIFFKYLKKLHQSVNIIDDVGKIPNNYNIIFANEFFDALPINQYFYTKKKWYEILITLDARENFTFSLSSSPVKINYCFPDKPKENLTFEYSEYMINLLTSICKKISLFGGIFLIIDYAKNFKEKTSSLSAIKNHTKVDIFHDLGNCDISHKPDFNLIKKICKINKCSVFGPFTQSLFLQSYGINERFDFLIRKNPQLKNQLLLQKMRLIGSKHMGNIFKVMIITDNNDYKFI